MVRNIVVGRIADFGGSAMFVNKDNLFEIGANVDVEVGDSVIGYIKNRNISKMFEAEKKVKKEFHLVAKTKRQKVRRTQMVEAIAKFMNYHKYDLEDFYKWTPVTYTNIFSRDRSHNISYARHLYIFLSRFIANKTLKVIAKECNFSGANHTTVIHGEKKTIERLSTNMHLVVNFQQLINECTKEE